MTFLLSQLRRRNQPPRGVLGEVLSADEASRGVELAFINRYTRRTVKASEIALKLASADLSKQDQQDKLEALTAASFALMQSASYGKIARELEREVPEDLGFCRFKGRK